MIIKLYDNESFAYPLIEIKDGHFLAFKQALDDYRKDEEYNLEDFIPLIARYDWFVKAIYYDKEVGF